MESREDHASTLLMIGGLSTQIETIRKEIDKLSHITHVRNGSVPLTEEMREVRGILQEILEWRREFRNSVRHLLIGSALAALLSVGALIWNISLRLEMEKTHQRPQRPVPSSVFPYQSHIK